MHSLLLPKKADMEPESLSHQVSAEIARLEQRASQTQDPVDLFYYWKLTSSVVGLDRLAGDLENVYQKIVSLPLEGDSGEFPFKKR